MVKISTEQKPLLQVVNLVMRFKTYEGTLTALDGVTFNVREGETLGLVGETGCGKTVTSKSIMRLLPTQGYIEGGQIIFRNSSTCPECHGKGCRKCSGSGTAYLYVDLTRLEEEAMRKIRGSRISMVFQEPMSAFNPALTIGDQITESVVYHMRRELAQRVVRYLGDGGNDSAKSNPVLAAILNMKSNCLRFLYGKMSEDDDSKLLNFLSKFPILKRYEGLLRHEANKMLLEKLREVKIPYPDGIFSRYSHELSGGMRQRALIAMALSCNPELLIADEPTTALDVTIQAQILKLMKTLQDTYGMAILFITHDLAVAAQVCDRVAVMYAGRIMEIGDVRSIFHNPMHPYTQGLLKAIPKIGSRKEHLEAIRGSVPDLTEKPKGCVFHPRCPSKEERCTESTPELIEVEPNHLVSCVLYK